VRAASSDVDFAQDLDTFGLGDAFKHGLTDPLFVKLSLNECEVPASVYEALGLVDIARMVVSLQEQGYWCPPVFGIIRLTMRWPSVSLVIWRPSGLRTAGVPMTW
jgi:hypothetical protein